MKTRASFIIFLIALSLSLAVGWLLVDRSKTALAAPAACVGSPHSGTITSDQEWCVSDNPHYVTGSVTVNAGVTLTIYPDVVVYFYSGTSLTVNGTLIATGTTDQSIIFTSVAGTPAPGDWGSINAGSGSTVSMAYCDVGYGGGAAGNRGFYIVTSNVEINTCRIHHVYGDAVRIEGNGLSPVFETLDIDSSTGWPIHQNTISQNPTYSNLNFHDNGTDALLIDSSNVDRNVTLDGSPSALNGAPIYYGGGTVNVSYTLTVVPGTTLKLGSGANLSVNGSLIADGTSLLPIVITSQAANPQAGDWNNFNVNSGSHVSLSYCDIGYAGSAGGAGRIFYITNSDVQIRHCRIHHALSDAVRIEGAGLTPVFEDVEIDHSAVWPVHQNTISQSPTYIDLNFHDNGTNALLIDGGNVIQDVILDGSPAALNGAPIYYGGGTVNAGYTLTIVPGTTLKLGSGANLSVIGTLIADGTSLLPIVITSQAANPQPGDWNNFNVNSGSHVSLSYCDVGYAGSAGGAGRIFYITNSDVQIRHCRIHHALSDAVRIEGAGLTPVFEDVEIDHSAVWPVHQNTISQSPTYINLNFHDNGTDALLIDSSNVDRNVTLDGSPSALNGAPIYYGGGTVNASYTLTIVPGTMLKLGSGANLSVNGSLIADGTSLLPIVITSQSANPQAGDWNNFNVNSGSHVSLSYCDVGYAGSAGGAGRIFYITNSDVQIRHCRIHHALSDAVRIEGAGLTPVFEDVEIDHSAVWPVHQNTISQSPTYINLDFHDNGTDALLIDGSNLDCDVTLDGSPAALNGAPIYYGGGAIYASDTLTVTAGTTVKMAISGNLTVDGALIAEGTPDLPITFTSQSTNPQPGDWLQIHANNGSNTHLSYCKVSYSGSGGGTRAVWLSSSNVELKNCLIDHSLGDAIFVDNSAQILLQNTGIINSGGSGLSIMAGSRIDGLHLTLAYNETGAYVAAAGNLNLTNTILSQNAVGVNVVAGGTATLTQTLWDRNETDVIGTINETGHINGPAAFDLDGYHLTRYSAALEQGIETGLRDDIDGDLRPMPAGTNPDLGADEYPYVLGMDFAAEKFAFDPQWVIEYDPDTGESISYLRQQYLLRYYYGSPDPNPPDLTLSVTDTLPVELDFEYETHNPEMVFTQQGQNLDWQTTSPVQARQSGEILLSSIYHQPEPGHTLVNHAGVSAEGFHFDLQATTNVPLFPPLIVSPGNGELCPDPTGDVVITGSAQALALIRVYENGEEVISTTTDTDGGFSVTYPSIHVGYDPETTISAKACAPSDPAHCSEPSQTLTLTKPQSFWCPQRSTWQDDVNGKHIVFQFRNNSGWFSTQDWVISGIYGFIDTDLTLYACNCPAWSGTTNPPSSVWVIADGVTYYPSGSHPWYTFNITGQAHNVQFWAQCGSNNISDNGLILIDPDGYVFDITQGFDPISPTLNAVAGVTVTAFISMPEWGGWVPWPAHLYNDQLNPQVTGEDGYFAFFTPPGQYYLQVDGIEGYQPWRSPVIEVITEVVHANVPYTPWSEQAAYQVLLTTDGPDPAEITISINEAIEWCVPLDGLIPPEKLISLYMNPVSQLLSDLGPINYTSAWDGGMMTPGQCYRRQFDQPGTFTYTDGLGHSGVVVVEKEVDEYTIILPIVYKQ